MNRPKQDFRVWSITPTHLYLRENILYDRGLQNTAFMEK